MDCFVLFFQSKCHLVVDLSQDSIFPAIRCKMPVQILFVILICNSKYENIATCGLLSQKQRTGLNICVRWSFDKEAFASSGKSACNSGLSHYFTVILNSLCLCLHAFIFSNLIHLYLIYQASLFCIFSPSQLLSWLLSRLHLLLLFPFILLLPPILPINFL